MRELGRAKRLPGAPPREDHGRCRHPHPDADGRHVGLDVLHHVVDRHARVGQASRRVDVEVDVPLGVLGLEEEHLRDDQVGHLVVDLLAEEDDPLAQQLRVDVEGPVAPVPLLDDGGDQHLVQAVVVARRGRAHGVRSSCALGIGSSPRALLLARVWSFPHYLKYEIMGHRERAPSPAVFPGFQEMAERRHSVSGQLSTLRRELGLSQAEVASPHGDLAVRGGPFRGGRPRRPALHGGALHDGARGPAGMEDRAWRERDWRPRAWPWLPPPGLAATGATVARAPLRDLARRLLAQRVVLLHGPLDDLTVTRVSAELMTLDAEGDDAVTLRVDCGEAALAPALTLMDVIELMGVPVRALCLGQVGAGAVGVVAVCPTARPCRAPASRCASRRPSTRRTRATWPSGPSCRRPSGGASASAWASPSGSPSTPSRRTWSGDAS